MKRNHKRNPKTNTSRKKPYSQKLMQYARSKKRNMTKANTIKAVVAAVVFSAEQVMLVEFILT